MYILLYTTTTYLLPNRKKNTVCIDLGLFLQYLPLVVEPVYFIIN